MKLILIVINVIFLAAQTKIVAHRGFSAIAPENTLSAFREAIVIGADYLELDVHKSLDDSLIVIHDETVDRTTSNNKTGRIAMMTYDQLNRVTAGYSSKFADRFTAEKLPTLKEVLELVKGKIKVCVEIKVKDIEEAVLDCINKLDMRNDVIIFSFDYPVVERIREMDKEIQTLFLKSQADQSTIDAAKVISANAIGVGSKTEITRSFLDAAHQSGIEVWQWTIDDPEKMKELFRLGIDGLITNHPDQALNLIKSE